LTILGVTDARMHACVKVACHPRHLSLAMPVVLVVVHIIESWGVNMHTTQCTSPISIVRRCSSSVESSTYRDLLYFQHWTIQAASQDVSV